MVLDKEKLCHWVIRERHFYSTGIGRSTGEYVGIYTS